jgi:hypothetical protein
MSADQAAVIQQAGFSARTRTLGPVDRRSADGVRLQAAGESSPGVLSFAGSCTGEVSRGDRRGSFTTYGGFSPRSGRLIPQLGSAFEGSRSGARTGCPGRKRADDAWAI